MTLSIATKITLKTTGYMDDFQSCASLQEGPAAIPTSPRRQAIFDLSESERWVDLWFAAQCQLIDYQQSLRLIEAMQPPSPPAPLKTTIASPPRGRQLSRGTPDTHSRDQEQLLQPDPPRLFRHPEPQHAAAAADTLLSSNSPPTSPVCSPRGSVNTTVMQPQPQPLRVIIANGATRTLRVCQYRLRRGMFSVNTLIEIVDATQNPVWTLETAHSHPWETQLAVHKSVKLAAILAGTELPADLHISPTVHKAFGSSLVPRMHFAALMRKWISRLDTRRTHTHCFWWPPLGDYGAAIIVNYQNASFQTVLCAGETLKDGADVLFRCLNHLENVSTPRSINSLVALPSVPANFSELSKRVPIGGRRVCVAVGDPAASSLALHY